MPKPYLPDYHPLPNAPGFWLDAWLTNYGCAVVEHGGRLYALGWSADPTPVDDLKRVPVYREKFPVGLPCEGQYTGVEHPGGWFGPLPVPSHRRYEMRKLKRDFEDVPPLVLSTGQLLI